MVLSLEARLFLLEQVTRNSGEYSEAVQRKFAEKYPDCPIPHRSTVRRLIAKVRETGSAADAPRSGRPPVLTEEKIRDISNRKLQSPSNSIRKLSLEAGVSSSSAHRALKLYANLFPQEQNLKRKSHVNRSSKLIKRHKLKHRKEDERASQKEVK